MKTLKSFFAVVTLIFALVGCDRELYVCLPEQKVVFQYERSNFAWGEFRSGWLIDSEGYVHAYYQPYVWNYLDSNDMMSKAAMEENLMWSDSICYRVDPKILAEKVKLIGLAAEGKLSEPVHLLYDFGAITYNCFAYDPDNQRYRCILLNQMGDFVQYNKSAEAKTLYNWLAGINALAK